MWEGKGATIIKTILKKNKIGRMLPGFKTSDKATVIKNVWHWQKDGHRDQWTKWRAQTIHLHNRYIQLVFDKSSKAILWRKDSRATNGIGIIQDPCAKIEPPHVTHTFYKN